MTPTPRSKSESKRLAITGKEGPPAGEAQLDDEAWTDIVLQLNHDNPGEARSIFLTRCAESAIEAVLDLEKEQKEALELDEKRVAQDSRRRAALEDFFQKSLLIRPILANYVDSDDPRMENFYKAMYAVFALKPTPKDESTSRGES